MTRTVSLSVALITNLQRMNKTERIYIRLTPEMKQQLQQAAAAENRTVTNYLENLVKQALKKEG